MQVNGNEDVANVMSFSFALCPKGVSSSVLYCVVVVRHFLHLPILHRMVNGNDVHNRPLSAGEKPPVFGGVVHQDPPDPDDTELVGALADD